MFRLVGRGLGCILIKSTLGPGKTQEGWRLEGEGLAGAIGDKRGQFTSNRGLRWTFRHKLEDAKYVELGLIRGSAMYKTRVTCVV
jgi:hypothetical protein